MSGPPGLLDEQTVLDLESSTVAQSLGGAFYGVFFTLTVLSIYVLACRGTRKMPSRLLLSAIILMLLCDTGSLVVEIISERLQIQTLGPPPYKSAEVFVRLSVAIIVLARVNYLLSDAIVIWRAWILFEGRAALFRSLLIICFVCSFGAAFVDGAFTIIEATSEDGVGGVPLKTRVILPSVLLATNLIVTFFYTIRAWEFRQFVTRKTQVGWVLMLFVQSGIIYCVIWTIALISVASNRLSADSINFIGAILPHITGIYPTIIVLLVFLETRGREFGEANNVISRSIRFTSMPPADQHISLVQRESLHN